MKFSGVLVELLEKVDFIYDKFEKKRKVVIE
jgi:hypothetical protein